MVGADETLAGYGRHRALFKKFGEERLSQELELDINRLWKRNLGRDDRVISDHGREARFPFLSQKMVNFLAHLPIRFLCNLQQDPGIGDKKLLRDLAEKWGLDQETAFLAKRAMQFGTRVNKAFFKNSSKLKGTDPFVLVTDPPKEQK